MKQLVRLTPVVVVLMVAVLVWGCSTDEKKDTTQGDEDLVDQDQVQENQEGEVVSETEVQDLEEDVSEPEPEPEPEAEPEPDADEVEPNPCALDWGTEKCPYCGRECQDDEECPPGYTCWFGECTRECIPDTEGNQVNDCGEGWGCHKAAYRYQGVIMLNTYYCARGTARDCNKDTDCRDQDEVCTGYWPALDLDDITPMCQPKLPCAAQVGQQCSDENLCETGWCMVNYLMDATDSENLFCSALCETDSDCPEGMQCRDLMLFKFTNDTPYIYRSFCVPKNLGVPVGETHKFCFQDDHCPDGQLCIGVVMGIDKDEFGRYKRVCATPTEGGAEIGAPCPQDGVCATQMCVDGICTRPCRQLATPGLSLFEECPDSMQCVRHTFQLSQDTEGYLELCQPYEGSFTECRSDADCQNDEVCGAITEDGQGGYVGHCIVPIGNKQFGETCDPTQRERSNTCANGLCLRDDRMCTRLCGDGLECPEGWYCAALDVKLNGSLVHVCRQGVPPADGDEDEESFEAAEQHEAQAEVESEQAESSGESESGQETESTP